MKIIIDKLKHGKNMTCKTDDKIMAIDISEFDKNTLLFAKKDLDSKIRIAFSCDNQPFVSFIAEILEEYVKQKVQIRQEVVQEIREEFEPKNATELDDDKISTEAHLVNFGWDRCKEKLLKKLDQIERGK